jgi:PAS domain S-box-containing protein
MGAGLNLSSENLKSLYLNDSTINELLEASNDGFWVWNIQTGEVYFSKRWIEMLGYQPHEINPHVSSWEKLVHPADMPHVTQVLEAHLKGNTAYYETEHRVKTKSGEWKWIVDRGRVIERDNKGNPLKAAGAHTDISEKKILEEERKENFKKSEETKQKLIQLNKQLEDALEARKKFLSIASHELKTPLTSLLLSIQAISKLVSHKNLNEQKEKILSFTKKNEKQILRLVRLIDEMLDITRIESGKMSLQVEPFFLADIMTDIKDQINDQVIELTKVPLQINIKKNSKVKWDRQRLEQVLINLITNSLKYGEGTPISIECDERDNQVFIEVSDQGPGIRDEYHETIFNCFERLNSNKQIKGLGLGLFISREILELHHGRIWIDKSYKNGAKFCLKLPKTFI